MIRYLCVPLRCVFQVFVCVCVEDLNEGRTKDKRKQQKQFLSDCLGQNGDIMTSCVIVLPHYRASCAVVMLRFVDVFVFVYSYNNTNSYSSWGNSSSDRATTVMRQRRYALRRWRNRIFCSVLWPIRVRVTRVFIGSREKWKRKSFGRPKLFRYQFFFSGPYRT